MRKKIIVFIAVIVIPILILVIDHFVLNEHIQVDAQYDQSQEWQDIIKNQDDYPTSLLKLAMHNKETIPFVSAYPQEHQKNLSMSLENDLKDREIPLLLQWDKRWGYKMYGDEMMGINGCGPTCLSMVVSYLKQNPQYNPYYIAQYAYQKGYYSQAGTTWALMNEGASHFGVKVQELSLDENAIAEALKPGQPIICSVRKGIFTSEGHFIVLREYKDGLIYVNDPNSPIKSQKGYTFQELYSQIRNLWVYSL